MSALSSGTVMAGACAEFYTMLGPGSDRHHYNHIHVDLLLHQYEARTSCVPAVPTRGRAGGRGKQGAAQHRFGRSPFL